MTAIPFITYCPDTGKYEVSEEAKDFLQSFKQPLGVFAIAGKYRTGKSFFLNRVLLNKTPGSGFSVGSSINACTKGIWLSTDTMKTSNGLDVLVMDTEGIGSLDADGTHDCKILSLALLLSSAFVYNSVGSIDDSALKSLSLVTNISKQIRLSHEKDTSYEELATVFPSFIWVVRDFSLRLENPNGQSIDEQTYMESALTQKSGETDRVREVIRQCFNDRTCFTMVRPCSEESDLQNLDNMSESEMRPVFVEQIRSIREKLQEKISPKTYLGHNVTGCMLITMAESFVRAINEGAAPVIKDSWQLIADIQSREVLEDSLLFFQRQKQSQKLCDPILYETKISEWKQKTIKYFQKKAMDSSIHEIKLNAMLNEICIKCKLENTLTIDSYVVEAIEKISNDFEQSTTIEEILFNIETTYNILEKTVDNCLYIQNRWSTLLLPIILKISKKLFNNNEYKYTELLRQTTDLEKCVAHMEGCYNELQVSKVNAHDNHLQQIQKKLELIKHLEVIQDENQQEYNILKVDFKNLQEVLDELRQKSTEDATLSLNLAETKNELMSASFQLDTQKKALEVNEIKFQNFIVEVKGDLLITIGKLTEEKQKSVEITQEIQNSLNISQKDLELSQQSLKENLNEFNTLTKISEVLREQNSTQTLDLENLQAKCIQEYLTHSTLVKELETKIACDSIDLQSCKKRLSESDAHSGYHKKLKIDLHRSQSDTEKHKSVSEWLAKDKVIKETRINDLQNQVAETEKRCHDLQRQYEIDLLKMRFVCTK